MQLAQRDRRALLAAGIAAGIFILLRFGLLPVWDGWQERRGELPMQETRLMKYRQAVQSADVQRNTTASLEAKLREAEGGLLQSATPALAAAELQDVMKQLMTAQALEMRSSEFLTVKPGSGNYVQVPLGVQFICHLDQLAGILEKIRNAPKVLTIPRLVVQTTNPEEKLLTVSMTVAGVMRAGNTAGTGR